MEFLLNLLKVSVIAGAVTAVLGLLGPALRRRYHAKWRYWVWLCLAVLLLSPLIPLPELKTGGIYRAPVQVEVPSMAVRYGGGEGLALTPRTTLTVPASPAEPATAPEEPAEEEPKAPAVEAAQSTVQSPAAARTVPVETVALALWAVGAAVNLLWVLGGTVLFSRRCMRWARRPDEATAAVLAEEQRALDFSKPVALYVTSGTASPAAMGLFRRRIVLPEADYEERHLRFVLRHELVHLKRHDLWVQLLLCAARAVHWFNPLIWWMVRQARADMELTCDDAVLAGAEQGERRAYSETLLAMLHRQRSGALTTHFYGGKELMKERFRNIMAGKGRRWGAAALCIALFLTTAALGTVACTALQPEALSEEELAMWQERVDSEEWYGFFVNCYSDAEHLDLDEIFRYGAGIAQEVTDPEERAEALALLGMGGEDGVEVLRYTRTDMDEFLREKTGYGLEDLTKGGETVLAAGTEDGVFYCVKPSWGVTYMGNPPRVMAGERMEDTTTLLLDLTDSGYYGHGGGMETAAMTIEGGKVVSYTNDVFTVVEKAAETHLEDTAQKLTNAGVTVESSEMDQPQLRGWDRENYTLWNVEERFLVKETDEIGPLLGEDWYVEDGWLHQRDSSAECLVVEKEGKKTSILFKDQAELAAWPCFGAYVRYGLGEGLQPTQWPLDLSELISGCLNTDDQWIFQRDEVARQYVEALGEEAVSLTVVEDDLVGDGAGGTVALMEAETASGERLRLVLREISADAVSTNLPPERCWQVVAAGTEEGELPASHAPVPVFYDWLTAGDQALYWQLSRECRKVEPSPEEVAPFALSNGVELGMTVEEVAERMDKVPSDVYLHMVGSVGFNSDQVDYAFYHTPEGERLVSIRIMSGSGETEPTTGVRIGSTIEEVLAALGNEGHPLRRWSEDVLYGDPFSGSLTDRSALLRYTTILGRYSIYRREGPVNISYEFDKENTLEYIDLRYDATSLVRVEAAPIAPAGVLEP